ncbi:hypothetical protein D7322_15680 [Sphingobacterium puteale]|uniref:Uncharacterized protein n=1 Tax=Sphingobacterium puteale TaxID=2420510 RepID=A0A420VWY8_9SPHI|nr:hypothetical protein D7322_15680 [Sphingobacterium puteale]
MMQTPFPFHSILPLNWLFRVFSNAFLHWTDKALPYIFKSCFFGQSPMFGNLNLALSNSGATLDFCYTRLLISTVKAVIDSPDYSSGVVVPRR